MTHAARRFAAVLAVAGLAAGCRAGPDSRSSSADVAPITAQEVAGLGYTHLLLVCQDKRRRERIAKEWKGTGGDRPISFLGPDEIVATIDGYTAPLGTTETTVRGYKVKVTRQAVSPEDVAGKRSAIAEVIARSLATRKAT